MEIRNTILQPHQLLIQKYLGEFSVDEYEEYISGNNIEDQLSNVDKILTDLTNISFRYSKQLINRMLELRAKAGIKDLLHVYLIDSPMAGALTHLYIDGVKERNYHYCSTTGKAAELLNLSSFREEIEQALLNL